MNNFYLLVPPISEEGHAVPERNQHTTVKSSASNNNLTTNIGDKLDESRTLPSPISPLFDLGLLSSSDFSL
jgi:hypothetical protein